VVPLFRPYRAQVAVVVGLIVLTSTIGIVNPLLIQAVFNKALFVPGGPKLDLLYILVSVMAAVPIVNGAIGILQVYGFPLPAWRDPLKGEEFSDGRDAQEVRQGLQGGRGAAGPGDR
jgi:hypothetical protein